MTRDTPVAEDVDDTAPLVDFLQRSCVGKAQLSEMEEQGLGVHNVTEGIVFDRTWSYDQVHTHLLDLIPLPLTYLNTHFGSETGRTKEGDIRPCSQWLLLSKTHQQLKLLRDVQFPSGEDLYRFCTSETSNLRWDKANIFLSKSNFVHWSILTMLTQYWNDFLASRHPIPLGIMCAWGNGEDIMCLPSAPDRSQSSPSVVTASSSVTTRTSTTRGATEKTKPKASSTSTRKSSGKRRRQSTSSSSGSDAWVVDPEQRSPPRKCMTTRGNTTIYSRMCGLLNCPIDQQVLTNQSL